MVDYSRPKTSFTAEPPLKAQLYRVVKLYGLVTLLASLTTWLLALQMMMVHIPVPKDHGVMRGEVKRLISPLVAPFNQEFPSVIKVTPFQIT